MGPSHLGRLAVGDEGPPRDDHRWRGRRPRRGGVVHLRDARVGAPQAFGGEIDALSQPNV